jgi:hypothetical protein
LPDASAEIRDESDLLKPGYRDAARKFAPETPKMPAISPDVKPDSAAGSGVRHGT